MSAYINKYSLKTVVMYTDFSYGINMPTGGTQRYLELIYGFIEKGIIVHLFIPKEAEINNNGYLIRHNIKKCAVSSFIIPNGLLNFLLNIKTLWSIQKINYDAIISFDVPCSINFSLLRLKRVFIFIRQDLIGCRKISIGSDNIIKKFYLYVLKRLERTVILHTHRIIVQCEYDKDVLLKRHRRQKAMIKEKIFIINNNVNPSWIKSTVRIYKKGLKNRNIKLAFVGDLNDPRKGLDILLGAVSILLDEGERLSLHVIGGGQNLDYYRKQNKNRANIKYWGRLKNPLQVTNECDLLVVPSRADSFPNTIIEAFYLELAVIGSNVGGIPEMLKYEDLIFSPNVADLVIKLRDIIHTGKLELYREYSRKRKKELTFDWVERVFELIRLNIAIE